MYPYREGKCVCERESDTVNGACFMSRRDISNFLAEIGEVNKRGIEEGKPHGDGERVILEGFTEGLAVDEDEDLAALGVERRLICGGGEVCGNALERNGCRDWEGVQ